MKFTLNPADSVPIYRQMGEQIRDRILDGEFKEGTALPDITTLADLAGVSLKTTERALNELLKEGLCFRRPKKGTYVGRVSRTPKKNICGIYHAHRLASFENDLVQNAIYRGITQQAEKTQTDVFFITGDPQENIAFHSSHQRLTLTGVIMLHWETLDEVRRLATLFPNIRFVHLNYYLNGFEETPANVTGVFNDDYAGAYQMTEHLLGNGHQRIALFSIHLANENYRQRIEGYRHALLNNGHRFADDLVFSMASPPSMEMELREAGRILAGNLDRARKTATAIFCVNDLLAAGVIEYLAEHHSSAPIEVCGYDHILPDLSRDLKFSTVHIDFENIGKKAVEIAAHHHNQYPKTIRLTPQLVIRDSRLSMELTKAGAVNSLASTGP